MAVNGFDFAETRFDFTTCCNEQDRCYNTCLSDKAECDADFTQCSYGWCESEFGEPASKEEKSQVMTDCINRADTLKTLSKIMGCDLYIDSQIDACSCADSKKSKKPKAGTKKKRRAVDVRDEL